MLRSSIERLRAIVNPGDVGTAGLVIGRSRLAYVEVGREADRWQVRERRTVPLPPDVFQGAAASETVETLAAVLRDATGSLRRRYLPLHVGLADPWLHLEVFELAQLPATPSRQTEFARWRLAEVRRLGEVACASQTLGADGSQQLLLAMGMDAAARQTVAAALDAAGLVPWTLAACSARLFNACQARLAHTASALIVLTPDCWSLWLCDSAGRPRQVRARWRNDEDARASTALAEDIERSIVAYVHGRTGRTVDRLLVVTADAEDPLIAALSARAPEACDMVPLMLPGGDATAGDGHAICPWTALAAAIATAS